MMAMVRRCCLALVVVVPCVASSTVEPDAVASAVCQQDVSQLTLMQLQATAMQLSKVKSHHRIDMPTLEEVHAAFGAFVGRLQDIGQTVNTTVTSALSSGEVAMTRLSNGMQVAENFVQSVSLMLGSAGEVIANRLQEMSDAVQDQIQYLGNQTASLRQQLQETLDRIVDEITGQADATVAKMQTANEEAEDRISGHANEIIDNLQTTDEADDEDEDAQSDTSNASLVQLQATLSGLQKAVQSGCLSKADTETFLHKHGRDSLAVHFKEVDRNGDGCIRREELAHSAKQLEARLHGNRDAVALLMVRAAAGHHLSTSSSLEEAVAWKNKNPCSAARSSLKAANTSVLALEDKMVSINASLVDLMEQTLHLMEASFLVVNRTVTSGLKAAVASGLPDAMDDPVYDKLAVMMEVMDDAGDDVRDAQASMADDLAAAASSATATFLSYLDGVSAKLDEVCAA